MPLSRAVIHNNHRACDTIAYSSRNILERPEHSNNVTRAGLRIRRAGRIVTIFMSIMSCYMS